MLKLHFAPNSRASHALWLLEELGLEYELNRMDFHLSLANSKFRPLPATEIGRDNAFPIGGG